MLQASKTFCKKSNGIATTHESVSKISLFVKREYQNEFKKMFINMSEFCSMAINKILVNNREVG